MLFGLLQLWNIMNTDENLLFHSPFGLEGYLKSFSYLMSAMRRYVSILRPKGDPSGISLARCRKWCSSIDA